MRYFIGFLITVGLIVLLVVLLIHDGGKSKVGVTHKSLNSYASTDAKVRITIDGPVNAVSLHEQVRITVDSNDVTFEHIKGYDGSVVKAQTYANTQSSYDVFLHSLTYAGFSQGDATPALRDERGRCALGDRYIFELTQDGKNLQRYWATSCGKTKTYLGGVGQTLTLFKKQVPDYVQLTQSIQL